MKGINGLIVAAALGIAGAVCNFLYIRKEAAGYEKVAFVAIRSDAQINPGDVFSEEDFEPVEIPRANLGNIEQIGILWDDRATAYGIRAIKGYEGSELLLQQDLLTGSTMDVSEKIGPDEFAVPVPVDQRLFVAENYNPGDYVILFPPITPGGALTPAGSGGTGPAPALIAGPFRILSIGGRSDSIEVQRASRGRSSSRADVITVPLTFKNGQWDDKAKTLFEVIAVSGNQVRVAKASDEYPSGAKP